MTTPQAAAHQRVAFDAVAHYYDRTIPSHVMRHYLRKRLQLITRLVPPGSRLLDIGCGTGRLTVHLQRHGLQVLGVDGSREMLTHVPRRWQFPRIQGLFDQLPLRTASVDATITIATLHHAMEPGILEGMLREMARVLKANGLMIVWDHNPNNPYWRWLMPRLPQDRGGYRLVSLRELLRRLRGIGGLEIVAVSRTGAIPDFLPRRALRWAVVLERWWERMWGARWLLAHNVVVMRKVGATVRSHVE